MKNRLFATTVCAMLLSVGAVAQTPDYKNPNLSPEQRTADLLSRMTVDEKLGQLLCPLGWPMYEKSDAGSVAPSERYRRFITEQHGGMLWATFRADPWTRKTLETGLNPRLSAETYNALQRYAMEQSRLGIPILLAEEAPHGHMAIGTTVFPTSIGLASTWSPTTLTEVGRAIAEELRAQGGHIGYGPVIDLAREPRWSRVEETYGEDSFLTAEMASAMLRGTSVLANGPQRGIVSTLKHFVAYGIPDGGHNGNPSSVGRRDLYESFLPPFHRAIQAGALSVMTSYNAIDGVPSTANAELLRDVLRTQWGFEGFVVSDLESIDGLYTSHHVATDKRTAAEMALRAGVDVDLGANCYPLLKQSLADGTVTEQQLDEAVGRVLRLKFQLGLFDHPYVDPTEVDAHVRTADHVALARKVARESVVLLENKRSILPLRRDMKIAVIGPNADNLYNQLGDYTAPQQREQITTVLDGIRAKVGEHQITYVKGCAIRDVQSSQIRQAVAAVRKADVAVVVVGGSSARDFRTKYIDTGAAVVDSESLSDMEAGEGYDRASLELLGLQTELLQAIAATGKPLVVVYIEGRPLDKQWAKEHADALLTLWYPGQEGGNALADVLFGDYNPAGRLPISVPRSVGQLPVYYNQRFPLGHDYVEMPRTPLYEFGYGLSYTTFDYSALHIDSVAPHRVRVGFDLRNSGTVGGEEVVQLYLTDNQASTVRPRKQLRAFRRLYLAPGQTEHLTFELSDEDFMLYNAAMQPVVEPGDFTLQVGASSEDIRLEGVFTL
jgi:beta-glucosidase